MDLTLSKEHEALRAIAMARSIGIRATPVGLSTHA